MQGKHPNGVAVAINFCEKHTRPFAADGSCPDCDAESLSDGDKKSIVAKKESVLRRRICGVPFRFRDAHLSQFVVDGGGDAQRYALAVVSAYANKLKDRMQEGGGLVLFGNCGTGKTLLACSLVHHAIDAGYLAQYTKVYDLIGNIKSTWSNPVLSEFDAIDAYVLPDLLVIDEIGVQFGSDAERQLLFRVLNARYEQVKPTIIVSNLTKDELVECIGERCMDRLKEGQGAHVAFTWGSHRK